MIAWLSGKLLNKRPPSIVLDVNGVGYELDAPLNVFYELPDLGAEVSLFVHMVVREDAQNLYGFMNVKQRDLFRSLIKVSGIGPKVGLAILSSLTADDLLACVAHEDVATLVAVPGIGKKTAQRLLVELKDKLAKEFGSIAPDTASDGTVGAVSEERDAIAALIALGYKPADASAAVRGVAEMGMTSEVMIRAALKNIGKGRA
ncbi:MAG TPA: Holliday junction branch migration protein RuvA [Gammaproteobacteria bacterium]|jgi:holliday junction DNA helicase RuvA|nr:Holliday junction branch migration protein RuvA [Pseudomonadota bacterium]HAY45868.1 Holliday junction branch migration protein RuvA [Gammaproteobacteria bacterium]